jgi:hypothetical protein
VISAGHCAATHPSASSQSASRRAARRPCPQLAQMRSADLVWKRLMLEVNRTYDGHHQTDATDPERTWRNRLLDHLVGAGEGRRRNGEAERPRGPQIEDELDLVQPLHRQVCRRLTLEDLSGIGAHGPIDVA